ncbi:MAG: Fic family protein [Armatimonadetes bacterium]|nr:Fic family protein [Armatimonadota bacterium]
MAPSSSELGGRMIVVGSGDVAYKAFVPNPLPPDLRFSSDLVSALSEADRSLGELAGLGRCIANPHLLIRPFMRREAVLSSRIEGTQANMADLYAYEAGGIAGRDARANSGSDVREVANYVEALEYGLQRLNTLPISLRLIREVHQRLMSGVRGEHATPGEFRRSQNWIGKPGCTLNDATFVPPPVSEMDKSLAALEDYLNRNDDLPPLLRIGCIHYQFETIHPFLDGNVRVGRLLLTMLLMHWKVLPLPLLYLSAYFERNRQEYYDRLLRVSQRGEWHNWLLFFFQGVADESRDAAKRAKMLQDLQSEYRQRLTVTKASMSALRLVDLVFESPILTVPRIQQELGVAYNSAKSAVGKLVDAEILRARDDETYGKVYVAQGVLEAVQ